MDTISDFTESSDMDYYTDNESVSSPKSEGRENFKSIERKQLNNRNQISCAQALEHIFSCNKCYEVLINKMDLSAGEKKNNKFIKDDIKEIIIMIVVGIFMIFLLEIFVRIIKKVSTKHSIINT